MKALVISGGGSKGAFAGGVAQYLMQDLGREYDLFLGTSTGSLLIPHLALNKIDKVYDIFTNVTQKTIFSINPFVVRQKGDRDYVSINYFNSIIQFIRRKRTFGESYHLRNNIKKRFTRAEYETVRRTKEDVVVTVSNLSKNRTEYKSIKEFSYEEFCDWIWISCNYIPFMSLVTRNGFEYADGGLGCVIPIREAILRGATEVDAIVLESENLEYNKVLGQNPFSLLINLFGHLLDQVERADINLGKLTAKNRGAKLNMFYTPTKLTENPLIFNKKHMVEWWNTGYHYAAQRCVELQNPIRTAP